MLKASTIQLLRFHFSFFLLPVYLFALSQVEQIDLLDTLIVFILLHLIVYPASNGYNSYMDMDETPIGGLEKPPQPTKQLFHITVIMDTVAVLIGLKISWTFSVGLLLYILASHAYSFRGIRLKKYPIAGYLTVVLFQGAVTFFLVYHGCSLNKTFDVPPELMTSASLLIGGFYPLTQIYQHEADQQDGVLTISALLGYKGTFIFTALVYTAAMVLIGWYFSVNGQNKEIVILATAMSPVLVYFFIWALKVWNDTKYADFKHTMKMNTIASVCTNLGFFLILIWRSFE